MQRCLRLEEECIKAGKTVCCYTTRSLIKADTGNKEDELRLSVKISDAVQSLVGRLEGIEGYQGKCSGTDRAGNSGMADRGRE